MVDSLRQKNHRYRLGRAKIDIDFPHSATLYDDRSMSTFLAFPCSLLGTFQIEVLQCVV